MTATTTQSAGSPRNDGLALEVQVVTEDGFLKDNWLIASNNNLSVAINLSPLSYKAGDANLYRYVGNAPTLKTDPSGLEEKGILYPVPWREFPGYEPVTKGGLEAGKNAGRKEFFDWLKNDPARARSFLERFQNEWGDAVSQVSRFHDVPEAVIWSTIYGEIVNFGFNDYHEIGASTGPGQLTPATTNYYGCLRAWNEPVEGTIHTRGNLFTMQYMSQHELGTVSGLGPKNPRSGFMLKHLWMTAHVTHQRARELGLAASGGGKITFEGRDHVIPAMTTAYLQNSDPFFNIPSFNFNKPGLGKAFASNLQRFAVEATILNRINPGATGGAGSPNYVRGFGFAGPQSQFVHAMFRDGYFKCGPQGKLQINISDR